MRHILILSLGMLCLTQFAFGQEESQKDPRPHIEVRGYAEKKIVPDEIYVSIVLKERESGKDAISLEEQEANLKKALNDLKLSLDLLKVSDAQADYIRIKWGKKDVVAQKDYELKLATAQEVAAVLNKLEEIKVHEAYIFKVSHSEIEELRKQVEIDAIKNAKEKADYLLAAIGETRGQALIVKEENTNYNYLPGVQYEDQIRLRMISDQDVGRNKEKEPIGFRKIKLATRIYVKFGIK